MGGYNDDLLTGGTGDDTFVFEARMRADVITDFNNGNDTLDFSSLGIGIGDLTITQIGTSTEIRLDAWASVTLLETDMTTLVIADDFAF